MGKKEKKEKVVKEEKEKKNNKIKLDKKKKIIILVSVIALLAVIGIILFLLLRKDNKEYVLDEVEPTISNLEDGSYYIFGSPKNQTFEVEVSEDFTYKILDEEANEVEVSTTEKDGKVVINAPKDLYEEGKIYTLTIENGTFTEYELKEAKTVSFSIVRESKQTSEIRKDVKRIDDNNIKIKEFENTYLIETSKKLNVGEVVVVENETIIGAYKIDTVKADGTYEASVPKLEEVYSEFDYYGVEYLDLSNIEENEELKEYLTAYAEENLIDKIIPKVYADSKTKLKLKYDEKKKMLKLIVEISTDPNDKVFSKTFLQHHKLTFTYEVGLKVKFYHDLKLGEGWDTGLSFEIDQTIKTGLKTTTLDNFKKLVDEAIKNTETVNLLTDDYKDAKKDSKKLEQNVGRAFVPTSIPGVNVVFTAGLLIDFDLKASGEVGFNNNLYVNFGWSNKKGVYGKYDNSSKVTAEVLGEGKVRLGMNMEAGVSLVNLIDIVGELESGLYYKGKIELKTEIKESVANAVLEYGKEVGLFSALNVEVEAFEKELSIKIFDDELPILSDMKKVEGNTEKIESVVKEDNKKEESKKETNNNKTEDKYYTVTIYPYAFCGDCNQETGLCTPDVVKVKAGDKLGNYKDEWGNPFGDWTDYTTYNTFIFKQNEQVRIDKLWEEAYEKCTNDCLVYDYKTQKDEWYTCHNSCQELQGEWDNFVLWPAEVTKNTIINQDYTLVYQSGCGSYGEE